MSEYFENLYITDKYRFG